MLLLQIYTAVSNANALRDVKQKHLLDFMTAHAFTRCWEQRA
jgi:hypothetical protein